MKYFVKTITLILTIVVVLSATLLSTSAAKPGKSGIVDIQLKGEKNIEGDTSPIEAGWAGAAPPCASSPPWPGASTLPCCSSASSCCSCGC